ncbi:MAG: DUF1566 domain-containing protein [Chitinophagaceae bacterium]|nr:DUF1566 domain-containing protein [Chitinophagaceae bacterium]
MIAYFYKPDDEGYDSSLRHGIILGYPSKSKFTWSNNGDTSSLVSRNEQDTTYRKINYGKSNTNLIVKSQGPGNYAAAYCEQFEQNGYKDWYLPSMNELRRIIYFIFYQYHLNWNTDMESNDPTNFYYWRQYKGWYWSSSEYSKSKAYIINIPINGVDEITDEYDVEDQHQPFYDGSGNDRKLVNDLMSGKSIYLDLKTKKRYVIPIRYF